MRDRTDIIRSLVPARMDRLPWSRFHWRMIVALGITWILDGIEIGLASAVGDVLRHEETLHLTAETVGLSGGLYLLGEVVGALYFGRKADRMGRRKLFVVTLAVYLFANALTACSFSTAFFLLTRFVAGMGIGGEYAAIHSAIDELTPARYRGRVDIAIAGTYWAGAMIAAASQIVLLDPELLPIDLGWRLSLALGPLIGIAIWPLRKYIPESPRWQLTHGQEQAAEETVTRIEDELRAQGVILDEVDASHAIEVRPTKSLGYLHVIRLLIGRYRRRLALSLGLMITQSFLYNAIFFTYALILRDFYAVPSASVGYYIFPFALGNLLGPLLLGRFFDTVGRRRMIALTYCSSALLLAFAAWLFHRGALTAETQTLLWCLIFFIASAAASSAYLTVSEIFPVEIRAQAISLVFATAQAFGATAPPLFGWIIAQAVDPTGTVVDLTPLAIAYAGSALIMFGGGLVAWFFGVDAERRSLEDIAAPLSSVPRDPV
ncbi:MAG: MFS transporter [Kofleriaceae bacterium]